MRRGGDGMKWLKNKVLRYLILTADSIELSEIVKTILYRYAELYEEEEVVFLSLPKHNGEERRRIISSVLEMEQHVN